MSSPIAEKLTALTKLRLPDDDGILRSLQLRPGAAPQAIRNRLGPNPPQSLIDLLAFSNGMNFFGLWILSIDEIIPHFDHGLIPFHNWGNGDFDCIATRRSPFGEGAIVFTNHSPDVDVKITDSLEDWTDRVVTQTRETGTLMHPMDYRLNPRPGLYRHVLEQLSGIDCELNR